MILQKINIEESILKKRLMYKVSFDHRLNRLTFCALILSLMFSFSMLMVHETLSTLNAAEITYMICLVIFIVFGCYGFFRVITERNLMRIESENTLKGNIGLLAEYGKKSGYEVHKQSSNCLILTESYLSGWPSYRAYRCYVFILEEGCIYYCSIKTGGKAIAPSLLDHWIVLRDVKKMVR